MGTLPMGNTREVRTSQENTLRISFHGSSLILGYSATGFLTFMGGYTVFLGPITGIMITDASFRSSSLQGASKLMAA